MRRYGEENDDFIKDTYRENTPSNEAEAVAKSMKMYIWAIGILNQLFIRDSYTQMKFSKKRCNQWQKPILCNMSILYSPFIVFTLAFERAILYGNVALSFVAV